MMVVWVSEWRWWWSGLAAVNEGITLAGVVGNVRCTLLQNALEEFADGLGGDD